MAILSTIYCTHCHQTKEVTHRVSEIVTVCHECTQKYPVRNAHLAARANLPIEQRLALIEAELYDNVRKPSPFNINTPIG